MSSNPKNRAYWQGFRDARIDALLYILEHRWTIASTCSFEIRFTDPGEIERYEAGYMSAFESFKRELEKEIAKGD